MMDWFKKHDVLIKALCVIIAAMLWFYVVSTDSPNIDRDFKNISVTLQNQDKILNNYGMMVLTDDLTVNLRVSGKREKVFQIGSVNNILVTADVSSITSSGTHRLPYNITLPVSGLEISSKDPLYISVQADKKVSKTVPVKVEASGSAPSGYVYGDFSASPQSIVIEGPDSELSKISAAVVKVDAGNVNKTTSWTLDYQFQDSSFNTLGVSHVTGDSKTVMVTLPVTKTKTVALEADVLSAPGVDKSSATLSFSPSEILITGDDSLIESLNKINVGTIDLDNIKSGDIVKFQIIPPNGVRVVEDVTSVDVTVTLDGIETAQFITRDIRVDYAGGKYNIIPETQEIVVTLRGSKSELAKITPENIYAIVTLSEETAGRRITSGTYTLPANIRISGASGIAAIGEYHAVVRAEAK